MPEAWTRRAPTVAGFYEVRMDPEAWGMDPGDEKAARIVYVDPEIGRFDATAFGGSITEPLWRWRGPIPIPDSLPADDA